MNLYNYLKSLELKKLVKSGLVSAVYMQRLSIYEAYLHELEYKDSKMQIYTDLSEFFNVSERNIQYIVKQMEKELSL